MNTIDIINKVIAIISFIVNIMFIISLSGQLYNYFYKKRYIRKILGFGNSDNIKISFSNRKLKSLTGDTNDYITYDILKAINNTIKLLTLVSYKYNLIETANNAKNEINIGSFLTNKSVNAYFTKFFPNFKYFVDEKYRKKYVQYQIDTSMIEVGKNNKFGYQIGDEFLEINEKICDYAFLIKLVASDFKDSYKKTVHILFGGSSMATVKASEYLLYHNKQIYERFKNGHYFFAIQINRIDNSINYAFGIRDFTVKMFGLNSNKINY